MSSPPAIAAIRSSSITSLLLGHGRRFTVTFRGYGECMPWPADPDGLGIVEAPTPPEQAAQRRVFAVSGVRGERTRPYGTPMTSERTLESSRTSGRYDVLRRRVRRMVTGRRNRY